ncbi:Hypothetical protein PACV_51 [Pacmanvirus A23]|uniref:Hypothetical protein n=1 Tax=Pacmanvirus A23 TaxID=1932881 RepID=UPI000A09373E|nr:Hypothetical protein B9W72_gp051 [Pacmanvirus A23]SIP85768.1 Hypothetical protein PACV_51 [Pacmanvirus A23]
METINCAHVFDKGTKRGQQCTTMVKVVGAKCYQHTRKRVLPKCPHGKYVSTCVDCKGSSICLHNKRKQRCKDCKGASICEHGKERYFCKLCEGRGICEHKNVKVECKQCGGARFCIHNKEKHRCIECDGASICEHKKRKDKCKDCGGSQICEHNIERRHCKVCDPLGHLGHIVRYHTWRALKGNKENKSIDYLGCDLEYFKLHIESQFKEGMTWDNYGEWHIDHIIPLKYGNPTKEELEERLDFTNCQPMWAAENIAKGNRWIG